MSGNPHSHPHRGPSRIGATLKALVRTRVTAGLLVILPLYITFVVVKFVFTIMRDSSLWLVEAYLRTPGGKTLLDRWEVRSISNGTEQLVTVSEALEALQDRLGRLPNREEFFEVLPQTLQWGTAIASVLLTFLILYGIGLFAANVFGRRIIEGFETLLERLPLVKTVYRSLKQILATFAGDQTQNFQRVALIPFPDQSMRAVGFITNTFRDSVTDEELCAVFIPTTPNPTTGYLQVIRRGDLTELNWSVEEAVRAIMSGGILKPDFLTIVPNKSLPADVRDMAGPAPLPEPDRQQVSKLFGDPAGEEG